MITAASQSRTADDTVCYFGSSGKLQGMKMMKGRTQVKKPRCGMVTSDEYSQLTSSVVKVVKWPPM